MIRRAERPAVLLCNICMFLDNLEKKLIKKIEKKYLAKNDKN